MEERIKGSWKSYSGKNMDFALDGSGFICWLSFHNGVILCNLLSLSESQHPFL